MNNSLITKFLNQTWKRIEVLLTNKGFKTVVLESEKSIRKFIYENIPDKAIVGLGNSISSSTLKIRDILLEKGNKVYYFWNGDNYNRSVDTFEDLPYPEFFITTADNITNDGKLVNHEYSKQNIHDNIFPKNIIAFTALDKVAQPNHSLEKNADYTIFDQKPETTTFTVAITAYDRAS